jgi:hypothetical protein
LSKIKVNEIVNRNGSSITIGDANTSTVAINSGTTLTGFSSTGIDDNATSTAITIDSSASTMSILVMFQYQSFMFMLGYFTGTASEL